LNVVVEALNRRRDNEGSAVRNMATACYMATVFKREERSGIVTKHPTMQSRCDISHTASSVVFVLVELHL
jgi:hypothetical protein